MSSWLQYFFFSHTRWIFPFQCSRIDIVDCGFKSFFKLLTNVDSEFHWTLPWATRSQGEKCHLHVSSWVNEWFCSTKLLVHNNFAWFSSFSWMQVWNWKVLALNGIEWYCGYVVAILPRMLKWDGPPINLQRAEITITYISATLSQSALGSPPPPQPTPMLPPSHPTHP